VVVNTARGPIVDIDALAELLKRGHLAGVGLDVIPVEPRSSQFPSFCALIAPASRGARGGSSSHRTPPSSRRGWDDTRLKAAETMRAALVGPRPQNVTHRRCSDGELSAPCGRAVGTS